VWARAVATAAVLVGVGFVPWNDNPLYRLAGGEGSGPDPIFDAPLNPAALREMDDPPLGATYFVSAQEHSPLVQGNVKAAGQLYLARGLPVQEASRARFAVAVRNWRIVIEPLR
jgi:hypothetical protein